MIKPSSSASVVGGLSMETSVTPRQRPKACQLNPINQFTIGLPPSPSPRNILSSPIDVQNFKAPAKTPENFNAQFEVDFTNIANQPTVIQQQPSAVISVKMIPPTVPPPPPVAAVTKTQTKTKDEIEKFDNLFKSVYPDPFGEHDDEIVEIQTNYVDTQTRNQQQLFETTPQQAVVKVNQHRRYMSDTSGFNIRFEKTNCDR